MSAMNSYQENEALLLKAHQGDMEARNQVYEANIGLVYMVLERFKNSAYEYDDLFQVGSIGLLKAIDKFDFTFNVKFSTYAVPMIIGEIRRFLRDDHPVKVPRSYKEMVYKINRSREHLSAVLGHEPTIGEIAADIGVNREDIVTAIEAMQSPTSIHDTLYQDDSDPIFVLDQLHLEKDLEPAWFEKIALKEVFEKPPDREKRVLLMRFYEDKTQSEIARLLNLSQVQISRIERSALHHIREFLKADEKNKGT